MEASLGKLLWVLQQVIYFPKVHCTKSEDYMPQESGSIERAGLKEHITFYWLHEPHVEVIRACSQ